MDSASHAAGQQSRGEHPARDRAEVLLEINNIPLLVRFFPQRFARRMKKQIESIPAKASTHLARYHWPGNVRELENVIERAVILSRGPELEVPLGELKLAPERVDEAKLKPNSSPSTLE